MTAAEFEQQLKGVSELAKRMAFKWAGATDAADIYQEACVRAWASQEKWKGESFSAWFLIILRRVAIDVYRKRRHHVNLEEIENTPSPARSPLTVLAEKDCASFVLRSLSKRERYIVSARLKNLSDAEIAQDLGVSAITVRTTIFRMRKRLKDILLYE